MLSVYSIFTRFNVFYFTVLFFFLHWWIHYMLHGGAINLSIRPGQCLWPPCIKCPFVPFFSIFNSNVFASNFIFTMATWRAAKPYEKMRNMMGRANANKQTSGTKWLTAEKKICWTSQAFLNLGWHHVYSGTQCI